MDIKNINFDELDDVIYNYELNKNNLNKYNYQNELQLMKTIILQSKLLSNNYNIVATNPPYMGNSSMNPYLKDYLKNNYPNSKSDLFAVFIEKCHDFCNEMGFIAMITQQSFMFLSTFENLRVELINNHTIVDMAHLGTRAFDEIGGEVVQATSFINRNNFIENYNSTFHRLTEFNSENKKEEEFLNDKNKFIIKQSNFNNIPSNPIAYWIDNSIINVFENSDSLGSLVSVKKGMDTGNNNKFLRFWFEVSKNRLSPFNNHEKWVPYDKGGNYRKWYGNNDYVVNWENDGYELKNSKANLRSKQLYFRKSITWNALSSSKTCFRYSEFESIFDSAGSSLFPNENLNYYLGLLNSKQTQLFLDIINPTLNYGAGSMANVPVIFDENKFNTINLIVKNNIQISKNDWDDYESSWNFKKHPFIKFKEDKMENIFQTWVKYKNKQFTLLKNNEIELNTIFSEIYSMNINCDVDDKYISLNLPDLKSDIKSFISYAVGCMFGRYSLDDEGLQFAGGQFDITNYHKFIPDEDNIIPVLDSEYFEDDIVRIFVKFVKTCFGEDYLEENIDFIANSLVNNKKPSRDVIRDYLLKNFFSDHKKIYKKCPIYWQFSSGKENGFNCLVYMHRYEPSLVARIRTDYLHKTQKAIEQAIANCDNIINHSTSNTEIAKATKDKNKLQKQLKETHEYDDALAYIANQNIEINLDDGVKVNYNKFQNVEVSREGKKSKKINLLKKL